MSDDSLVKKFCEIVTNKSINQAMSLSQVFMDIGWKTIRQYAPETKDAEEDFKRKENNLDKLLGYGEIDLDEYKKELLLANKKLLKSSQKTFKIYSSHIFRTFAFMNYTFTQGALSIVELPPSYRNIQSKIKNDITLRVAVNISNNFNVGSNEALNLSVDLFHDYLLSYLSTIKITKKTDSHTATIFALEQIQRDLRIGDNVFDYVIPQLIPNEGLSTDIESLVIDFFGALQRENSKVKRKKSWFIW